VKVEGIIILITCKIAATLLYLFSSFDPLAKKIIVAANNLAIFSSSLNHQNQPS